MSGDLYTAVGALHDSIIGQLEKLADVEVAPRDLDKPEQPLPESDVPGLTKLQRRGLAKLAVLAPDLHDGIVARLRFEDEPQ